MKKEEYREARREFGETAAGLGKEVRKEAREAYRNVRESADTRMKEIKEELPGNGTHGEDTRRRMLQP